MKLYLEDDNSKIEIREIESINKDSNILFFMLGCILTDTALERIQFNFCQYVN